MENEQIAELERLKEKIAQARIRVEEAVRDEFWALENEVDERIYQRKQAIADMLENQHERKEAV